METRIKAWHRASEASQRLETVPGIGPLTATALVACIRDAKNFDIGRQFAAWLGAVPKQHFGGGKPTLLGMSKRCHAYLRTMLIHGARSAVYRTSWDFANWGVHVCPATHLAYAGMPARTVSTKKVSRPRNPGRR